MNHSITSYEQLSFYDEIVMTESLQQSEIFSSLAISSNLGVEILKHWNSNNSSEFASQAVVSEIPTLLANGALDHVTPMSNAIRALKHLNNSYKLIFLDEGHDLFNPCFFQITKDFFNSPFNKPDIKCGSIRNPIEWNLLKPIQ